MAKQRDPFWDTLKAILIVLVVLGHTGMAMGEKWLSVIYAFHMPLFIFVSGYFSKRKSLREFGGGISRLIIIYLVFDIAYVALDVVMGESLSVNRLLTPSFALWYILSLIYWRVILQILPQSFLEKKGLVIFSSLLISVGAGFIPVSTEMSFQRACAFMPFFFIGYYAHKEGRVEKMRQWNKLPFAFIFVGMCSLCYFYLPIFYSNSCYENVADCGMRVLQLGVASLMCIALLNIVPKAMGKFTEMGKHTLIIYLLHPPMIKVMNVACLYFGIGRTPLIAIIMCTISVTLIYFVRNMIFLNIYDEKTIGFSSWNTSSSGDKES